MRDNAPMSCLSCFMAPALWGFLGTLVGAIATIAGSLALSHLERRDRKEREAGSAVVQAREERKRAYLRLLTAARQLRYLSRPDAPRDQDAINSLRTELSIVHYEIELISPREIVERSDLVRRRTLDYLNDALEEVSGDLRPSGQSAQVRDRRLAARSAIEDFVNGARGDLGVAAETTPRRSTA